MFDFGKIIFKVITNWELLKANDGAQLTNDAPEEAQRMLCQLNNKDHEHRLVELIYSANICFIFIIVTGKNLMENAIALEQ